MRGELLEPGGCSAWPTSAWAIATRGAAGVLPAGAATGATAPAAPVPVIVVAPAVSGVAGDPVTEAVRSICAKASFEDVAVVAAGGVGGGGAAAAHTGGNIA